MRKRCRAGALIARDGHLMLVTLRPAGEVIAAKDLPAPEGRAPSANERKMADQLVGMLEDTFDPAAFEDRYRQQVEALVAAKARGRRFTFERAKRERKPADLERALAASLERMKERAQCLKRPNRASRSPPDRGRSGRARSASAWSACR